MPSDRWQRRQNDNGDRDSGVTSRNADTNPDRAAESSRTSFRSRDSPGLERDNVRSDFPNKARRLDDKSERSHDIGVSGSANGSRPSLSRRADDTRDSITPSLTIRGVAASNRGSSPPQQPVETTDNRQRRARSPDLFDRLERRRDEKDAPTRTRAEGSLRSRLESETSRAGHQDSPRRVASKLAPRGQYDESGRRIDEAPTHLDPRDRRRGPTTRDDIPTSPRKLDTESRRQRDRSRSPLSGRARFRAGEEDKVPYRDSRSSHPERARTSQRSPSPTSAGRSRSHWDRSSNRTDRYERNRSPTRSSDRYAPEDRNDPTAARSARWGTRAHLDDKDLDTRSHDRRDQDAPSHRRRTPSPALSDTTAPSRARNRDKDPLQSEGERAGEQARPPERPARWRLGNNDQDDAGRHVRKDRARDAGDEASDRYGNRRRQAETGRERPPSPGDRRPRTTPRAGRAHDEPDRGNVLLRKSGVDAFDGKQPPTGPRRMDSDAVNQRSVRGGGWQTVRPGSGPDRNAGARHNSNDRPSSARNGRDARKGDETDTRRDKSPVAEAVAIAEPARAEPGEAYESIHQVGEGTYGQVFKARSERTGALVALKKIRMDAEKDGFPVTAMREIKLLQALRHENVVRLHEMMVTRGSIYMIFEYMEHDLNGILAHPQVQFSDAHLKSLAMQLFSGLDYLHRKAVLHRDLKGSNILLNNQGRLKLADFGLARFYAKRRPGDYTNRVVTLWYRPPELLFGETQYGSEVDMWGAGCIFLELFVKKPVFQSETELGQIQAITDILGPVRKETWPDVDKLAWYEMVKPAALPNESPSDTSKDYMASNFSKYLPEAAMEVARGLLTYDPKKRWSAKQALASSYFSQSPKAELPAGLLSSLEGEWHEFESRRAKKKASGHRGSDRTGTDLATVLATSSNTPILAPRAIVHEQQPAET